MYTFEMECAEIQSDLKRTSTLSTRLWNKWVRTVQCSITISMKMQREHLMLLSARNQEIEEMIA